MDENRVTGTAKNVGGKIEEGLGRIAGDNMSSNVAVKSSHSRITMQPLLTYKP